MNKVQDRDRITRDCRMKKAKALIAGGSVMSWISLSAFILVLLAFVTFCVVWLQAWIQEQRDLLIGGCIAACLMLLLCIITGIASRMSLQAVRIGGEIERAVHEDTLAAIPVTEILVRASAEPPVEQSEWDVYWSVQHRKTSAARESIRLLLAHGADPNLPARDGHTAIMYARYYKRPDLVALLKQPGEK